MSDEEIKGLKRKIYLLEEENEILIGSLKGLKLDSENLPIKGKVLIDIKIDEDENIIYFATKDNNYYAMLSNRDYCTPAYIKQIDGDINDLLYAELIKAELCGNQCSKGVEEYFSFYKFATRKGYVDISWYNNCPDYYCCCVDFIEIKNWPDKYLPENKLKEKLDKIKEKLIEAIDNENVGDIRSLIKNKFLRDQLFEDSFFLKYAIKNDKRVIDTLFQYSEESLDKVFEEIDAEKEKKDE